MYRLIVVTLSAFALVGTLAISTDAVAKKGGSGNGNGGGEDPPPPIGPIGDECAGTADFPSLVYQVSTTENAGSRNNERTIHSVYLASSDRSCSLLIYRGNESVVVPSGFVLVGSHGQIISRRQTPCEKPRWCNAGEEFIRLAFDVDGGGAITTPLPLVPETVYNDSRNIGDPILSPDGNEIYFSSYLASEDPNVPWLATIEMVDLAACTPPACSAQVISSGAGLGFGSMTISPDGTRIYTNVDDAAVSDPGTYGIALLERDADGSWLSDLKYAVNNWDDNYSLARFGVAYPAVALLDLARNGTLREVLAVPREEEGAATNGDFDLIDVEDCHVLTIVDTCVGDGSTTLIESYVEGWIIGFTGFPSDANLATGPTMFVLRDDNGNLDPHEIDPITLQDFGVVASGTGFAIDSAD